MKRFMMMAVVAAGLVGLLAGCSSERRVKTDKLNTSFAAAPADVKAEIQKATTALKERKFTEALTALKTVVDKGNLTADQKQALEATVLDIQVIVSENPPATGEDPFTLIEDIYDKLHE